MPHTEDYDAVAGADLVATDYFWVRRTAEPVGSKDAKFAFPTIMLALINAANKPVARAGLGIITATATLDFPSTNAVSTQDLTIAVLGAAVGDAVHLGLPAAPQAGIIFQAFVSATDVVKVRCMNITASPVDPASATYRVVVIKSA